MADSSSARREEARIKRLTRTEKLALIEARAAGATGAGLGGRAPA
jgi:predicted GIY-YIG superfamily endonuclease